jgi:hypothetical protein
LRFPGFTFVINAMQPNVQPPASSTDYSGPYAILEKELAPVFIDKLPAAPFGLKEGFVKYFPWITVVLMVFMLPVVLFALGMGAVLAPISFLGGLGSGFAYTLSMLLSGAVLVLDALALPGLFGRKRSGWVWAYYAQLLSIASSLVSFSLFSILFGAAFLWLLFQVRNYYK